MGQVGKLLLMLAIAAFVVVGIVGTNELSSTASINNSSQVSQVGTVISPMFLIMGFLVLLGGAMLAIDAYR